MFDEKGNVDDGAIFHVLVEVIVLVVEVKVPPRRAPHVGFSYIQCVRVYLKAHVFC